MPSVGLAEWVHGAHILTIVTGWPAAVGMTGARGTGSSAQAVVVHQLSKMQSQSPFRKLLAVQRVLFHPSKPVFFVAVRAASSVRRQRRQS